MNLQLSEILPKIEEWLKCNELSLFKIGVTNNIENRSSGYGSGWQLFEIATVDSRAITTAETDLIDHFLSHGNPLLKEKCSNEPGTGGKGNVSEVNTLYVAVKHNDNVQIEDLHVPFSDITPITL